MINAIKLSHFMTGCPQAIFRIFTVIASSDFFSIYSRILIFSSKDKKFQGMDFFCSLENERN